MRYVVYLTKYAGSKLPPYYIGSTNEIRALSGKYFGSVTSIKWKEIFYEELQNHPELFSLEILSFHVTRKEALEEELRIQQERDVVRSTEYFNQSYASQNGYFGGLNNKALNAKYLSQRMKRRALNGDHSGARNPMFGKKQKLIKCEYCTREVDSPNYKRSHGEKCKANPERKVVMHTCQVCEVQTSNYTNIVRWHNEKCKPRKPRN